jgi:SPOR domain
MIIKSGLLGSGCNGKSFPCGFAALFCCFVLLVSSPAFAQKNAGPTEDDEIVVSIEMRGLGSTDATAIYYNSEVYLSASTVFDFLKIKNTATSDYDSVSGYIQNQNDVFLVDKQKSSITYQGKVYTFKPGDMVQMPGALFIRMDDYKTAFSIDGVFNFRRLAVTLTSSVEFPAQREIKQELMRQNISHLKGDRPADTTIKRTYPGFHFGTADWSIISTQQSQGFDETRLNLGLGAVIAGGEANASLNFYNKEYNTLEQQFLQWHYVDNDNPLVKQVALGNIFTNATSSLYAPVIGAQFSNAPTIYRKAYGTYTLSNTTEPNWIVELYVNDVLVDYKRADASGFFSFEVPMVYGYSAIKLRFYGPYGEERVSTQYITIPFNLLPEHEFEYNVNAGIVEDGHNSRFSRESINYGVSDHLTIGGGYEYLSSVTSGPSMPFVDASMRLASRLLLTGEYTDGVRSRAVLSYRLPSNLQVDLDYTNYVKGQTAIFYNYLEERKAVISLPFRTLGTSIFTRLTVDQVILPNTQYTNMEWAFSGAVHHVGLNFTTYASLNAQQYPYAYSILSAAFQLPKKVQFTSQVQYDYKSGSLDFVKFTAERQLIGRGYMNISYQDYFNSNNVNFLIGMRYDFSFTRVSASVLQGNKNTYSRVESASGSIVNDSKTHYLRGDSRNNLGRAEIVVVPYLDINCNGRRDPGEPKASGLKIRINGGRIVYDPKDSCIRVFDLEPYNSYYVELDNSGFDDISWQLQKHVYKVMVTANNFTEVDVPVAVMGEVSGTVTINNGKGKRGEGQVILDVFDTARQKVAHVNTEADGYFNYMGLAPGNYTIAIDSTQLAKLNFKAVPAELPLHIKQGMAGDVVDNIEFNILPLTPDTSRQRNAAPTGNSDTTVSGGISAAHTEAAGSGSADHHSGPAGKADAGRTAQTKQSGNAASSGKEHGTQPMDKVVASGTNVTLDTTSGSGQQIFAEKGSFAIQLGAFLDPKKALAEYGKVKNKFAYTAVLTERAGFYKVRIVGFDTRNKALLFMPKLRTLGFYHPWVVQLVEPVVR